MRKLILVFILVAVLILGAGLQIIAAQDTTNDQSTVQIFFVACETSGVMNLTGYMQPGYDVYYQFYSASSGTGSTLSALRRVAVNGDYAFSEEVAYSGGSVAAGAIASARIVIATEGNPDATVYETTVDDFQDGCAAPQNPTGTSDSLGSESLNFDAGPKIRSPFGGYINNTIKPTPEPVVVIGAKSIIPPRSDTPGMIFAECDAYPQAQPGLLYDNDNIVIFWSWYAKSPELVEAHLAQADYGVRFQTEPVKPLIITPIQQRGSNYWVFFYANIGHLSPGTYGVEYKLRWNDVISDGYADFGPGTENVRFENTCTFDILPNVENEDVKDYSRMYSLEKPE